MEGRSQLYQQIIAELPQNGISKTHRNKHCAEKLLLSQVVYLCTNQTSVTQCSCGLRHQQEERFVPWAVFPCHSSLDPRSQLLSGVSCATASPCRCQGCLWTAAFCWSCGFECPCLFT